MIYSAIVALVTMLISMSAFASISCSEPLLKRSGGNNAIYHFKSETSCLLNGEKIDLTSLKELYKNEILHSKSQFKVHSQSSFERNNMHGYKLDVTQRFNSNHGSAAVRATILLLDDALEKFYVEFRSQNINGDGEQAYNKSILNQTILKVSVDSASLKVIREIDVEDPWYAPDFMFFRAVENEFTDSSTKGAMLNARKISGQVVEALHN